MISSFLEKPKGDESWINGGFFVCEPKVFDYIKANFQYSVLENYNARMDDNYILSREKWWKDTLCTRQFGYNKN